VFSDKPLAAVRVDLNADLGERLGGSPPDLDRALMRHITSANVACGFHAGDPAVMRETVLLAREHGVAVGAHPSFRDLEGFGRREFHLPPQEVENLVRLQIEALAAIASAEGVRLAHLKPHGALYNMAARDATLADAVARATASIDRSLVLFGLSGSALIRAGRRAGLRTACEAFADRAYRTDGTLVSRNEPGAVIDDPGTVVSRALSMVKTRSIAAIDGTSVPLDVDTICVHGDTPGAAELARRIRLALAGAGVDVKAVAA